ncbi:MAG TPA: Zn-ribbon domain-containing OB-fold protein [Dehalococcoidia bacterium]|nr:Zn-ribbon domain-containing OB-fold protein [Dehalococcoidia bacterium]
MTTEYRKPLPNPAHWPASKPFWEAAKRHELVMPRCRRCDKLFFYPREVCPYCLQSDIDWQQVSGRGRLYSFTVIHQPANAAFLDDVPYIYAMVQLDEGPRMISNLVDIAPAEAKVDMPVVAVFDDVTPEWTLVKFRPA